MSAIRPLGAIRPPPPPPGAPPPYNFVTKYYGRTLRPIVLLFSTLSFVWTLVATITAFKALNVDNIEHYPKLATFSTVEGILFLVGCIIAMFGFISAVLQRIKFVRLYAFGSAFAVLLVFGMGLMRVIVHFSFKTDLMNECIAAATGNSVSYRFGVWGNSISHGLTESQAQSDCSSAYSSDSWAEVISMLIELVLGLLFTAVAFAYLRQLMDPTSPANSLRTPSNQARLDAYPSHYSPPYNSDATQSNTFAPPAGPPPFSSDVFGKPPAYAGGEEFMGFDAKQSKEDPFADFEGSNASHSGFSTEAV